MNFEQTFPLIYLLNLSRREDRRLECEAVFAQHGLRVRRFPAVDALWMRKTAGYETKGRRAHALSTRLIIRQAKQEKAPAVFIFEDDVVLADDWRERLAAFTLPGDWGMFALGGQHHERPEPVGDGLVRIHAMLDTHAWGVRAECYDAVLAALRRPAHEPKEHLPATDVTLARLQADIPSYATWPNTAWQQESHSDLAVGAYSNYEVDGWQRPGYNSVGGLLAEMIGGHAWPEARRRALEQKAWFKSGPVFPGDSGLEACATTPSADKVAFLFLTRAGHHQPAMWEEYWSGQEDYTVYAHLADPEARGSGWLACARIADRISTSWGDVSLVRVQMALLRAALKDPANGFFVFCSESCVPVRPFRELQRILKLDPRSRFGWKPWSVVEKADPQKALRPLKATRLPRTRWIFHSQWILLNHEAASLLAEDDLTPWFEGVFAPDECYPGTVLNAKGYPLNERVVNTDVTWTDWQGGPSPVTLSVIQPALAASLATSGAFFARKLSSQSNIGEMKLHL
jgi:Core-2/I-Branching enzyme